MKQTHTKYTHIHTRYTYKSASVTEVGYEWRAVIGALLVHGIKRLI